MSWYNTTGACPNHVLFSKVRYIRNVAKGPFCRSGDTKRVSEPVGRIDPLLNSNGFRGESVISGVNAAIISLCEKQFIERDFAYSSGARSLYINEPCNLLVAVGGADLISISSVTAGLSVDEALNMASKAEELIDRELSFAYSDKIGYLSPLPTHCGSGLTLSSALYLPSLRLFGRSELVRRALSEKGLSLTEMFSYSDGKSDLYILSYIPYRFSDESAAASFFSETVSSLFETENESLGIMLSGKEKLIYGEARRALGTLLYCESLGECEMLDLISKIRLAICISKETAGINLPGAQELNFLSAEGLNASLIASSKEGCISQEECDTLRAAFVKRYINHKNEVS